MRSYIFLEWSLEYPMLNREAPWVVRECCLLLTLFICVQEQFLVPDHTIKDISGASFAGFYYICFQKSAASIEGYYYHRSSEWWGPPRTEATGRVSCPAGSPLAHRTQKQYLSLSLYRFCALFRCWELISVISVAHNKALSLSTQQSKWDENEL